MLDDVVRLMKEIKTVSLARAETARRAAISLRVVAADTGRQTLGPASKKYVAEEELAAVRHLLQLITETRNEAVALTLAQTLDLLRDGLPMPVDPGPPMDEFLQADELAAMRHLLRLLPATADEAVALTIAQSIGILNGALPIPLAPRGAFRRLLEEDELAAVRHLLHLLDERSGTGAEVALEGLTTLLAGLPVALRPSPAERDDLCTAIELALRGAGDGASADSDGLREVCG